MNHSSIRLWHVTKSEFYTTTSNNQLSGWTQRKLQSTSQSQICPPKRFMVTGVSLLVWSTIAFWIPVQPWHTRSMLSRLMRCTKNCNACSQHWSQRGPSSSPWQHKCTLPTPGLQKSKELGYEVSPSAVVTWPLTNCYHFFKHLDNFLQGKCFHNQQQAENTFQEFTESWSTDFLHCRNKQMYVLVKMCWL